MQCYIQVTKNTTLKTRKDFQWWRKISLAIRCTNIHKYDIVMWVMRTNNFVMIFREV